MHGLPSAVARGVLPAGGGGPAPHEQLLLASPASPPTPGSICTWTFLTVAQASWPPHILMPGPGTSPFHRLSLHYFLPWRSCPKGDPSTLRQGSQPRALGGPCFPSHSEMSSWLFHISLRALGVLRKCLGVMASPQGFPRAPVKREGMCVRGTLHSCSNPQLSVPDGDTNVEM